MAMDHFLEEVVVKRNNGLNRVLYALSWLLIVFGGISAAWGINVVMYSFSQGFAPFRNTLPPVHTGKCRR